MSISKRRFRWPRGLRRGSAAARLLGLWVRIPLGARTSVSCECCVLSGRGLGDGTIPRPEETYWVWSACVFIVCECACVCVRVCVSVSVCECEC